MNDIDFARSGSNHRLRLARIRPSVVLLFAFASVFISSAMVVAQERADRTVVDIPSRPGVTQRLLLISPPDPRALVLLFAGGHGGLQLTEQGSLGWGAGNFLVRSRQLFAAHGLMTVLVDAPSDRQSVPYLTGFRDSAEHVADVKATIAWARAKTGLPVWLIGTSRGSQSVAFAATELGGANAAGSPNDAAGPSGAVGPDGLVLSSTVLNDPRSRAVPTMALERLKLPILVVHHEQDTCRVCRFSDLHRLTDRLDASTSRVLTFDGGISQGDPCEARAHHGFNGIEAQVVGQIAAWILSGGKASP